MGADPLKFLDEHVDFLADEGYPVRAKKVRAAIDSLRAQLAEARKQSEHAERLLDDRIELRTALGCVLVNLDLLFERFGPEGATASIASRVKAAIEASEKLDREVSV